MCLVSRTFGSTIAGSDKRGRKAFSKFHCRDIRALSYLTLHATYFALPSDVRLNSSALWDMAAPQFTFNLHVDLYVFLYGNISRGVEAGRYYLIVMLI